MIWWDLVCYRNGPNSWSRPHKAELVFEVTCGLKAQCLLRSLQVSTVFFAVPWSIDFQVAPNWWFALVGTGAVEPLVLVEGDPTSKSPSHQLEEAENPLLPASSDGFVLGWHCQARPWYTRDQGVHQFK